MLVANNGKTRYIARLISYCLVETTMLKRAFLLSSLLLLANCAHTPSTTCAAQDWQALGNADGLAGHAPQNILQQLKECGNSVMTASNQAYQDGWRAGATRYCRPSIADGYKDALAGLPIENIYTHNTLCQTAGIPLISGSYRVGWKQGHAALGHTPKSI